jgi:hypothetical protein
MKTSAMSISSLTNGLFPGMAGGMQKYSANRIRKWARARVDLGVYFSRQTRREAPRSTTRQGMLRKEYLAKQLSLLKRS